MARPFQFANFLILATARKRYPFAVLSGRGLLAYFDTRESAQDFITSEGSQ